MNLDVDPAKVLYALGVLFGVAAVLYFARDIVFELSITVRALLLLLAFVVLLVAALVADGTAAVLGSSLLSAAAYLAFVTYTITRFDLGADGTFFALLVSAALFLGLGYLVRERGLAPSRRTAGYVTLAVVLVGVALVGADVAASEVEYDATLDDEVDAAGAGEVDLGTLTVENRFVFREPIDPPRAFACAYAPGTDNLTAFPGPVDYRVGEDWLPDSVPGSGTIVADMRIYLREEYVAAVDGPVPIVEAETCPAEAEEPQIVVIVGEDRPELARPAPR